MPRLDPRQRLIREALLTGAAGVVVLVAAAWWAIHVPSAPQALAGRNATIVPAPPITPAPTACLWRPLSDTPEVVAAPAPPPPPTMRLISLSRRDDRWTALVDPGDGSGSQRVTGGEQVAGWQVDAVGQNSVELSSGDRRHQLKFGP
jgi:hypothetical protein